MAHLDEQVPSRQRVAFPPPPSSPPPLTRASADYSFAVKDPQPEEDPSVNARLQRLWVATQNDATQGARADDPSQGNRLRAARDADDGKKHRQAAQFRCGMLIRVAGGAGRRSPRGARARAPARLAPSSRKRVLQTVCPSVCAFTLHVELRSSLFRLQARRLPQAGRGGRRWSQAAPRLQAREGIAREDGS